MSLVTVHSPRLLFEDAWALLFVLFSSCSDSILFMIVCWFPGTCFWQQPPVGLGEDNSLAGPHHVRQTGDVHAFLKRFVEEGMEIKEHYLI